MLKATLASEKPRVESKRYMLQLRQAIVLELVAAEAATDGSKKWAKKIGG